MGWRGRSSGLPALIEPKSDRRLGIILAAILILLIVAAAGLYAFRQDILPYLPAEWRSMLRRIAHSPALEFARWTVLQELAKTILNETESPTMTDLPPLEYQQTKRIDHRLSFRR